MWSTWKVSNSQIFAQYTGTQSNMSYWDRFLLHIRSDLHCQCMIHHRAGFNHLMTPFKVNHAKIMNQIIVKVNPTYLSIHSCALANLSGAETIIITTMHTSLPPNLWAVHHQRNKMRHYLHQWVTVCLDAVHQRSDDGVELAGQRGERDESTCDATTDPHTQLLLLFLELTEAGQKTTTQGVYVLSHKEREL